jgi:peptide methionine sulfoxide reductase MsrA
MSSSHSVVWCYWCMQDMFSENPEEPKVHEVEKSADGNITITNANLVPMNADDQEEVSLTYNAYNRCAICYAM